MPNSAFRITTLVLLVLLNFGLRLEGQAPGAEPALVLVLAVDQMRPDYFSRFGDQFEGGLKYLVDHGLFFEDAHQDHANTVTGAGHSTILSGLHPARTGIIGNDWYDRTRKKVVYCTDDPEGGSGPCPKAMHATAFGDWLLQSHPTSKAIAISRKDRSAILMPGQNPTGVYWYQSSSGHFVTSPHYSQSDPQWVKEFNASKPSDRYFGKRWERLLQSEESYRRSTEDDQEGEGAPGSRTFPYAYSGSVKPDSNFYNFLSSTPFIDELTLEFARAAVRSERLGRRDTPDLLALSLSATDSVGHRFGPDSQEVQDMILRLDRYLGDFFAFLDDTVGLSKVLIVLTADHGVQPLPEVQRKRGVRAIRVIEGILPLVRQLESALERKFGKGPWIEWGLGDEIYLNQETIKARRVSSNIVEQHSARFLRRSPVVQDVFTRTELLSGKPHRTPYSQLYLNSFHPGNSGDLLVQAKVNHLLTSSRYGTGHSTPYPYDTRVPIVFAGYGITPGRVAERARTIDIGPTLAELLHVSAPSNLDGRPLIRRAASTGE